MPKGKPRRSTSVLRGAPKALDVARVELVTKMFAALEPYAVDCARTAGMLGAAKGEKPGHLTAATKVMDFLAAHAGAERDEAVERLLGAIQEIRTSVQEKQRIEGGDGAVPESED